MIHPTAVIHPNSKLASDVKVDAYVVIGSGVEIGAGTHILSHSVLEGPELKIGKNCTIGPHANIKSHTEMGDGNKIYPFFVLCCAPQDLKFKGENSWLKIGNGNTFRESVTLNRGTVDGGGITTIGDSNLLMAYVHVAHDCILGDEVVIANNVALAGHVEIQDGAIIGGLVGISQFCRIGKYSYIGGCTGTNKDIPPFMLASGSAYHIQIRGVNAIGLRRRGFSADAVRHLKEAYKILFKSSAPLQEGLKLVKTIIKSTPLK